MHTVGMKYTVLFAVLCLTLFTAPPAQAMSCTPYGFMYAECSGQDCTKGFEIFTSPWCGSSTIQDASPSNLKTLSENLIAQYQDIPSGLYVIDFEEWQSLYWGEKSCASCQGVLFGETVTLDFYIRENSARRSSFSSLAQAKLDAELRNYDDLFQQILNVIIGILAFSFVRHKTNRIPKLCLISSLCYFLIVWNYFSLSLIINGWVSVVTFVVLLILIRPKTKSPAPVP